MIFRSLGLFCLIGMTACSGNVSSINSSQKNDEVPAMIEEDLSLNLSAVQFSQLPNWTSDNFTNFSTAYQKSCEKILNKQSQDYIGNDQQFGKVQEWQIACRKFSKINTSDPLSIRAFFEENFIPYEVKAGPNPEGLFTGYYEASLKGSRIRQGVYQTPLRARPDDLVMVQLGEFRDELKGQRIAGRVIDGKLKPYETHAEINAGKLPDNLDKPIVWVDSAVDAFFLQIQGSGIVQMDDGSTMRIGYAGQNGHPYYAVGRELIARGELTKENVSMQSIRAWMASNPENAQELMETNKSYVFFRELGREGPIGGSNVSLTPMRSLAIDHSIIPYGIPVWLSADHPQQGQQKINQLMMAQDTGGAIRGAVRGDVFWGYGEQAEKMAGAMKSNGRYWFLIPKTI